jgi:RNA polymerase sigma-70 factor (ECF subfamily)
MTIDWMAIAARAAREATTSVDVTALARHLTAFDLDRVPDHVADVAIAFAAAGGDPGAQSELHRRVVHAARTTLPAAGYAAHIVDDTIGELELTLLGEPSPLLKYRGQSSLAGWLRTLAARTAMRLVEVSRREVTDDDASLIDHVASSDLTRDLSRAELRELVRRAFATAIGRLSYFDRDLLASFIVRGHSVDTIAKSHDVHRATAARWMARARAALDRELASELESGLGATDSEVRSLVGSVRSSIELSVERLLAG